MRRTHRPLTVVALMSSLFMAALEMTVVSTAMPTVIGDLGGLSLYAWVFTAYMLTATVLVPIYGKLADLYGRKPLMLVAIALFLVGSMASGQARTMTQLIAFRAVQGVGAGGMQPIALTIVGDIYDVEQRAKMQGVFGAVWGVAGLIGPLMGGLIVRTLGWRWVFYVNVPFGLIAAALLVVALAENVEKKRHTLDVLGAFVLSLAVVALLLGAQRFHPWILVPFAIVLVAAFVRIERAAKEPLLPIDLLEERIIAISSVVNALAGGAMIALVTYVPLFVQGTQGGSATEAGAAIAPMAVSWPIASALGGRLLPRIGFRPMIRLGLFLTAVVGIAFATLTHRWVSPWTLRALTAAFGVGMGFSTTSLIIAVQTSVDWKRRGVATASTMFFRTIGSTLAVGAMGGVLAAKFAGRIDPALASRILGPERRTIPPEILGPIAGILASGLGAIFWIVAALCVAAFVAALPFPRLRTSDVGAPRGSALGEGSARAMASRRAELSSDG
jgi:EmrB/QacA subfamily drug resistance transporter